jgi:hypothetical protein
MQWDNRAWAISDVPEGLEAEWTFVKPCSSSWPQFSPLSNAPTGIKECIQDEGIYAEFHNKHVYALDDEGGMWQWELLTHGFDVLIRMVVFTGAGSILGLLIASALLVVSRQRGVDHQSKQEIVQ